MKQFYFKKTSLMLLLLLGWMNAQAQKTIDLTSPNGILKVSIKLTDKIYYDISSDQDILLKNSYLQLNLENTSLGENPKLMNQKRTTIDTDIKPVVPLKFSIVRNNYNDLLLNFKGNYAVEFRAFDDGIAYRFITKNKQDTVNVMNEDFAINFPDKYLLHLQQHDGFKSPYEESYSQVESNAWQSKEKISNLPILIDTHKQYKIFISESDLTDYPCMFLKGTGGNGIISVFPKVPLKAEDDGDRSQKILKRADYIARVAGKRTFPWRYFVITKDDKQLLETTMTCRLASPCEIQNTSWIEPGQVSWEWWNGACPYGPDVNFVSGCNLATYKYYIDFASKFGIPYILMDEGWAKSTTDPFTPNPEVDVKELIRYGKTKNVKILLWLTWLTVEKNFDLFKTFKDWGIAGVKIDFMERSDQWMVNYYERVAKEAAKNDLLVDFHGAFKPAGLEYRYPNVISYEGVRGMEQMNGITPDNSIYLPFMRNLAGAMDYTPGAMIDMQPDCYSGNRPNAASIGTRAYQMALYVVFESGLQMLADNPTLYYKNEDCTKFITQVPTTWDETKALYAKVGNCVIVAKRKGNKWFIGGITNHEKQDVEISLDFLSSGKDYEMETFSDGINANRQAMDYCHAISPVHKGEKLTLKMARNGGFAAVIQ